MLLCRFVRFLKEYFRAVDLVPQEIQQIFPSKEDAKSINVIIAAAIELQKKTNKTNEKPSQHELYRFFGG